MRRDNSSTRRRWLTGICLVPLALATAGCASRQAPLVLPALAPAPTSTTSTTRATATTRKSTTTAPSRAATTAPPVVTAVPPTTTVPVTASGRVGAPRPANPGTAATTPAPAPPSTAAPVPRITSGSATPAGGLTAPTTNPLPLPAPAPALQVTAPGARAVPEGPFDVLVTGTGTFELVAQPATVCVVDAGRIRPVGAGECRVRATAAGFTDTDVVVRIRRGDPSISWQLGATTTFTYNTVALDLRATSGRPVQVTDARGTCKLAGPSALSFAVVGPGGVPQLGQCDVTAVVDESAEWNGATITLTTTSTRAPVTLALDVPATSSLASFTAKVTLTQADRSLDNLLTFSIESAGACSLGASATLANPSTRTASLKATGSAPASSWCAVRVLTDVGGAAGLVSFTKPACRFVWIGTGSPPATKPACPW